jgi:hypothetical protein
LVVFWGVAPCSPVEIYRRFKGACYLHHQGDDRQKTATLTILVGFKVLTAVSTKMAVFWFVAPCSLVEIYRRFRGACCLQHQGDDRQKTAIFTLTVLFPFPLLRSLLVSAPILAVTPQSVVHETERFEKYSCLYWRQVDGYNCSCLVCKRISCASKSPSR